MRRDEALRRLRASQARLNAFPIKRLAVFGSVARDEAGEDSDVDILVEFEPEARVGLFEFARLRRVLSEILGCEVDLATPDALRRDMRAQILQEAVYAAYGLDAAIWDTIQVHLPPLVSQLQRILDEER